tara:strand:- start:980 stop:2005 length:1026 start_codon:yes stop_codon:yes gene_type:complete
MANSQILITGGFGYIGSHTVLQLLEANYSLVILDNFSNSNKGVIDRINKIAKKNFFTIEGDITDRNIVRDIFSKFNIKGVIHLAGLKSVEESEIDPLKYYKNNVYGSLVLFEEMEAANIKNIVFSSSATVYGKKINPLLNEECSLSPANVYGETKVVIENILRDLYKTSAGWKVVILRYFNPIGAHPSGFIGESPSDLPNNLMPYISQVAVGKRDKLLIFGDDYPTSDGTGKRDYIHVCDLAKAHLLSLNYLFENESLFSIFNIGTGKSYSVLEVIKIFEKVSGVNIPFEITARRLGDVAECIADPTKAKRILGWEAELDLYRMCEDSWRWQKQNPNGIQM